METESISKMRNLSYGKGALLVWVGESVIFWGVALILAKIGVYTPASLISSKSADLIRFAVGCIAMAAFLLTIALSVAGIVKNRSRVLAVVALLLTIASNWIYFLALAE
jgi:hypothetical protein